MQKKTKVLFMLLLVFVLALSGCSKEENTKPQEDSNKSQNEQNLAKNDEKTPEEENKTQDGPSTKSLNFVFKDGLPALSVAKMMDEKSFDDLNFDMVASPDALTAKVLNKEADFAIVPSNFAAIAFNKNLGYKIAGVSVWGNTYIITDNQEIKSLKDLQGKTLTSFAKGMTPDIITKFVLNGEKVEINYLSSASEIAPTFLKEKNITVVAPEPVATVIQLKKEGSRKIANLNEEVKKLGMDSGFPQAVLIVKSELLEKDSKKVSEIIESYAKSIKWAKENKNDLAELSERLDMKVPKPAIIKGLDSMNLGDMDKNSKDMYQKFFDTLFEANPKSIGGKVPTDDAYYER